MRGIVRPAQQYPGVPLKTETSRTPIPIPAKLALMLSATTTLDTYSHLWPDSDESTRPRSVV